VGKAQKAGRETTPPEGGGVPAVQGSNTEKAMGWLSAERVARQGPGRVRVVQVIGASEHNLKHIDVAIPRNALTVITGLSGSGKSSLAFDTIYAEGQRRYIESLSSYARQFLDQMQKPNVDHIDGLSPAISIEQKSVSKNPRSTVGTITEIYDYLRVLYATIGQPHCPECGRLLEGQTVQQIADRALDMPEGTRLLVLAPIVRGRKGEYRELFERALSDGFTRALVDGEVIELETIPTLDKRKKHDISVVIDRLVVRPDIRQRLTDSVELALKKAEGLVTLLEVGRDGAPTGEPRVFSEKMACSVHGPQIVELTPRMFSFNSPYGACTECRGIGTVMEPDPDRLVPDPSKSINEGAIAPMSNQFVATAKKKNPDKDDSWGVRAIRFLCEEHGIDMDRPFGKLSKKHRDILLYGGVKFTMHHGKNEWQSDWEGFVPAIKRRWHQTSSDFMREWYMQFFSDQPCTACNGHRLKPESLAVTLHGYNISEFCSLSADAALEFVESTDFSSRERAIGEQAIKEIRDRLTFLRNVGLGYLTLDRAARTLAGGEGQRIRLATQIGSQLVGVLYILDEPSIGLHHRDNRRLLATLERLRDMGNTVIVVEHDEETIRAADYVIDLGPGAGRLGGEIVAAGTPEEVAKTEKSLTGQYLSGKLRIEAPTQRRTPDPEKRIVVRGARQHNLKGIDAAFPIGLLTCVTGVSGSGKSTLVNDILFNSLCDRFTGGGHHPGAHDSIEGLEHIDKVIDVDQSPIGRTPRSNPATYTNLFTDIRSLFAKIPDARARGYQSGRFSFNVKGGRCENCHGDGMIKVEMHFLPDVYVECEVCHGRRFNRETLEILYRGKSIADVLEMTVEEALDFFANHPSIREKIQTLNDVGLGYIHLGQPATTLSGGEAQRIKLSRELSKRNTGRTLYILDEPTTGLHFHDIRQLLGVLNRLVDAGSTVIVIEHNLDVIKTADWIVDLGPEGGDGGGSIVAEGTPEQIARAKESHTGESLRNVLTKKK
jgi:excinuclease ABC subunit A